jgi:WD40 repeat protein
VSPSRLLVVTGSWDKSICFWAVRDGRSPAAARPRPVMVLRDAAGDFIKAVHGVPSSNVLLSGGSDRIVRAWDMLALAQWASAMSDDEWNGNALDTPRADVPKPQLLAVLREHTRPITCLATLPGEPGQAEAVRTLFSSDSMGRTLELSLEVSRPSEGKATAAFRVERELRGSETGVYDVRPGWRAEEQQDGSTRWAAEVWTGELYALLRS